MTVKPLITLEVGQPAPAIVTKDVFNNPIELSSSTHRFALLAFMRYSDCPWCNLAIHRLALEYKTFLEHDCEIIAFIQSDAKSITENIHDRHAVKPEFPIIADPECIFYEQYGVRSDVKAFARSITKIPAWVRSVYKHDFKQHTIDGQHFLVPAYFLIDTRTNTIASADYGKSFYDHDTFVDLYEDIFFRSY